VKNDSINLFEELKVLEKYNIQEKILVKKKGITLLGKLFNIQHSNPPRNA
jgi:hypothetical protein